MTGNQNMFVSGVIPCCASSHGRRLSNIVNSCSHNFLITIIYDHFHVVILNSESIDVANMIFRKIILCFFNVSHSYPCLVTHLGVYVLRPFVET